MAVGDNMEGHREHFDYQFYEKTRPEQVGFIITYCFLRCLCDNLGCRNGLQGAGTGRSYGQVYLCYAIYFQLTRQLLHPLNIVIELKNRHFDSTILTVLNRLHEVLDGENFSTDSNRSHFLIETYYSSM